MTQIQLFYQEQRKLADLNHLFMMMVNDGLTKKELAINIHRRPELWSRFENWLDKLPAGSIDDTTI